MLVFSRCCLTPRGCVGGSVKWRRWEEEEGWPCLPRRVYTVSCPNSVDNQFRLPVTRTHAFVLREARAKRGGGDIYFPILFGRGTSIIEEFPGVILYIQLCAYFILVLLFRGIIVEILGIEDCRDCEEIKSLWRILAKYIRSTIKSYRTWLCDDFNGKIIVQKIWNWNAGREYIE